MLVDGAWSISALWMTHGSLTDASQLSLVNTFYIQIAGFSFAPTSLYTFGGDSRVVFGWLTQICLLFSPRTFPREKSFGSIRPSSSSGDPGRMNLSEWTSHPWIISDSHVLFYSPTSPPFFVSHDCRSKWNDSLVTSPPWIWFGTKFTLSGVTLRGSWLVLFLHTLSRKMKRSNFNTIRLK